MATPKVNLTSIKIKTGIVYRIDYSVNGKRVRQRVGSNKYNAEIIRAKIEKDLLFGSHNISTAKPKVIDLKNLIEEMTSTKKHYVRSSTEQRYRSYFTKFEETAVESNSRKTDNAYRKRQIDRH